VIICQILAVAVEVRLLYSQTFTNSRFHFAITPKCCFRSPNSRVGGPAVPSDTTATVLVSRVGLHFYIEVRYFVRGNLFGLLRKDSGNHWLHNNGIVEMAIYEWLEKQESDNAKDRLD
jgi:hypothetical protein